MTLFERRFDVHTHDHPTEDQPYLLKDSVIHNEEGRVGPPILLWLLGVPGGICVLLWFFFFRG
jgi:hypothetical protein